MGRLPLTYVRKPSAIDKFDMGVCERWDEGPMDRTPPPNRQGNAKTRITRGPDVLRKSTHTPTSTLGLHLSPGVEKQPGGTKPKLSGWLPTRTQERGVFAVKRKYKAPNACGRVSTPSTGVVSSAPPFLPQQARHCPTWRFILSKGPQSKTEQKARSTT